MKFTEIRPKIIYVKFDNQYEACMTMLRMQEYYESPYNEIRGKYFTLEEYMDRYAKQYKHFTYDKVWDGFNLPNNVLEDFYDLYGGRLRERERNFFITLLNTLGNRDIAIGEQYYVIAGSDNRVITHETAHAYYYLKPEYKKEMNQLIKQLPKKFRKQYEVQLVKLGYAKSVLKDELQAYFVDSIKYKRDLIFKQPLRFSGRHFFKPFFEVFKKYDSKKAAS